MRPVSPPEPFPSLGLQLKGRKSRPLSTDAGRGTDKVPVNPKGKTAGRAVTQQCPRRGTPCADIGQPPRKSGPRSPSAPSSTVAYTVATVIDPAALGPLTPPTDRSGASGREQIGPPSSSPSGHGDLPSQSLTGANLRPTLMGLLIIALTPSRSFRAA